MLRSPQALARFLDAVMSGDQWQQAAARVGGAPGMAWQWKRSSRMAEAAGDVESEFYFAWPVGAEPDWFHCLLDRARARRARLLTHQSLPLPIHDGRAEWATDDFGQIVLDEFGLPVPGEIERVEPRQRPQKVRLIPRALGRPRIAADGSLARASMGAAPPKPTVPLPSSIDDYVAANAPKAKREPSELERDLRAHLARTPTHSKPEGMVQILGRGAGDPPERNSRPNDASGLPTQMPDRPARAAPAPSASVDYSRHGKNVRLDAPGRGN